MPPLQRTSVVTLDALTARQEAAIAGKFVEAAMTYADHPAALQLCAMNIIYETTKERGATILIPTSMVDSMNPVVALAGQGTPRKRYLIRRRGDNNHGSCPGGRTGLSRAARARRQARPQWNLAGSERSQL